MIDPSFFQEYTDKGISAIPVRKIWDDKKEIYSGKISAIKEWNRFCKDLPDEDDIKPWADLRHCTGFAFATGEAGNLACVDIDTEEPDLAQRIADVLPYSPCRI